MRDIKILLKVGDNDYLKAHMLSPTGALSEFYYVSLLASLTIIFIMRECENLECAYILVKHYSFCAPGNVGLYFIRCPIFEGAFQNN